MCAGTMGLDLYSSLCSSHDTICTTQTLVEWDARIAQLRREYLSVSLKQAS